MAKIKNDMDKIDKMISDMDAMDAKYDAIPDTDEEKKREQLIEKLLLANETLIELQREYDDMQKKHKDV